MSVNRGKDFEDVFKDCVEKVSGVSIIRLHDQTSGYIGSKNPCDFIMYKYPYMYAIECKSVHGNTLSISSNPKPDKRGILHGYHGNITDYQWEQLLKMSDVKGVIAGVVCWWVDKDVTLFMPIKMLNDCYEEGWKSVNYQKALSMAACTQILGKKKRVFFDYDMDYFFHAVEKHNR